MITSLRLIQRQLQRNQDLRETDLEARLLIQSASEHLRGAHTTANTKTGHNGFSIRIAVWPILFLVLLLPSCMHRHFPSPASSSAIAATGPITLAVSSVLVVRTAQVIDSSSAPPGQTFAVVISRDSKNVDGQTALPSGSPAILVLRIGSADHGLELRIATVTLNGDSYLVRGNSEASPMPIGAGLGAFIGGSPGVQHATNEGNLNTPVAITIDRQRIQVPLGSLLTFRLTEPIQLIGSR